MLSDESLAASMFINCVSDSLATGYCELVLYPVAGKHCDRIDCAFARWMNFKMAVWPCAKSSATHVGDLLPLAYLLTRLYQNSAVVAVTGQAAVCMANVYKITITAFIPASFLNNTIG